MVDLVDLAKIPFQIGRKLTVMNEQKFNEIVSNIKKMNCSDNHKKYLVTLITEFNDMVDYVTWVDTDNGNEQLTEYVKFCYAHYRHDVSAKLNIQLVVDMLCKVNLYYLAKHLSLACSNFAKD